MTEATQAQPPRVRASAAQTAKGAWQIDVTVETFDGADPVQMLATKIVEVQKALRERGQKLVTDAA
jgi:hypothetical protein